jgi:hypothetical protein
MRWASVGAEGFALRIRSRTAAGAGGGDKIAATSEVRAALICLTDERRLITTPG